MAINKNLTRSVLSLSILLLSLGLYSQAVWLGLPKPLVAGRFDTAALCCALMAYCALILLMPRKYSLPLIMIPWSFVLLLMPLNWWNYGFYQDVLVWSSMFYGADALEGAKALGELGYTTEALLMCSMLFFMHLGAIFLFPKPDDSKKIAVSVALLFCVIAGVQWYKFSDHNEKIPVVGSTPVMAFFRSMGQGNAVVDVHYSAAIDRLRPDLKEKRVDSRFPLYVPQKVGLKTAKNQKNVILIVLESVRASETGLYGGTLLTPNLDRIAKESVWVSDYYSNTTQTVRAETSALCGVLDYNRGSPFSKYSQPMRSFCLPEMLSMDGYDTLWFHGYKKAFFDRENFFPNIGFSELHDRDVIATKLANELTLGWGISDEDVFGYALNVLESKATPFFAEILTLSNHFPFDWEWEMVGHAGLNGIQGEETIDNYHRGIKYTDYALGVFWKRFKASRLADNTAVFIIGDHGVWVFDEDDDSDSIVKNEKYFRVPFVAYMPDKAPKKLNVVASHIDLPATILNYLGRKHPSAFLGLDVFAKIPGDKEQFSVMIKNGSYGVRQGDTRCYPVPPTCLKDVSEFLNTYQRCETSVSAARMECVATKGDMLHMSDVSKYKVFDFDTRWVMDITEYMDKALMLGFIPEKASPRLMH